MKMSHYTPTVLSADQCNVMNTILLLDMNQNIKFTSQYNQSVATKNNRICCVLFSE